MAYREILLFPHDTPRYKGSNWAETVMGEIVRPAVERYRSSVEWYWMTRYGGPAFAGNAARYQAPSNIRGGLQTPEYLQIRLKERRRWPFRSRLEKALLAQAKQRECFAGSGPNNPLKELALKRFIDPEGDTASTREHRAELIARFLCTAAELYLDMLVPDWVGGWCEEWNGDTNQNPDGSAIQSVLHMFCNGTDVEIPVRVLSINGQVAAVAHPYYEQERFNAVVRAAQTNNPGVTMNAVSRAFTMRG